MKKRQNQNENSPTKIANREAEVRVAEVNKATKTNRARLAQIKDMLLEALAKHYGIIVHACRDTKISPDVHYRLLATDPDYKMRYENIRIRGVDFAESQLISNIKKGREISILYYLKCKGGHEWRDNKNDDPNLSPFAQVDLSKCTDAELSILQQAAEIANRCKIKLEPKAA